MVVSTVKRGMVIGLTYALLLLFPHDLFAAGKKDAPKLPALPEKPEVELSQKGDIPERPVEIQVITELQDRYNALAVPAMIMLPITGTSAISADFLLQTEKELFRQLVNGGKVKPVVMHKWLYATYGGTKANNPIVLINAIKAEQYKTPVQYIGKASLFRGDNNYFFILDLYPVATYYPVTIFRVFNNISDISSVLMSCMDEMNIRLFQTNSNDTRKRVIIDKFKIELVKLAELGSGEFEYISTPFIEHRGVPMRDGDDFFSSVLGYVLVTTDLFQVLRPMEFSDYTNAANIGSNYADYYIQGRAQVSERESVLYVDVVDIRTGKKIVIMRYPLLDYSFRNVWNAYREISCHIVKTIYDEESFGVVPVLSAPNRGFFTNNMFVGWETLENFILAKGLHKITTGSYFRAIGNETQSNDIEFEGNNQKTSASRMASSQVFGSADAYYILLDTINRIYTDRHGEYLWNLLNK